jgi:hypothetical protein
MIVSDDKPTLDFDREASSFEAAVTSALTDIERAEAQAIRVDPIDL